MPPLERGLMYFANPGEFIYVPAGHKADKKRERVKTFIERYQLILGASGITGNSRTGFVGIEKTRIRHAIFRTRKAAIE